MSASDTDKTLIGRIAAEPTVHFLLLAGLLFAGFRITNPELQPELQIDWQEIEARILISELNAGQPLDPQQRQAIEDAVIDDYVLVYESYALGLENDPRINDILAQKMRHVLSGNVIQPSAEELQHFYQRNLALYQIPDRITVEELVFANRDALPDELVRQLQSGLPAAELDTPLLFTLGTLPRVAKQDLASIFSVEYAESVFGAAVDLWTGPFVSNRGQHWLRVTERFAATQLALDEIIDQVRLDWITDIEEQRLAEAIAELRQQYRITITNRPSA
ncbi:MAG: peptidyl-prolyl cis-trans isomerase [Pseudohongiellaceae bacterium]